MDEKDSILLSIKKMLGITADYKNFDTDMVIHINSVFAILNQLGVGPEETFTIEDDMAVWSDFIQDKTSIESVRTYVYLKVKLIFDPPQATAVLEAMKQMVSELEWRLNIAAEEET